MICIASEIHGETILETGDQATSALNRQHNCTAYNHVYPSTPIRVLRWRYSSHTPSGDPGGSTLEKGTLCLEPLQDDIGKERHHNEGSWLAASLAAKERENTRINPSDHRALPAMVENLVASLSLREASSDKDIGSSSPEVMGEYRELPAM